MFRQALPLSRPLREVTRATMLGLVYFLAACLAVRYTRFEGGVALIWIANAFLFADLRYRPERSWTARTVACWIGGALATAFCRQLTGITKIRYAEVTADLALLEMPRGYMHVRLFDEADQQEFTSPFSTTGKPVTPSTIATLIMINPRFLADEWVATKDFPDNPYEARGVLDLLVSFRPRLKRLDFFDVD